MTHRFWIWYPKNGDCARSFLGFEFRQNGGSDNTNFEIRHPSLWKPIQDLLRRSRVSNEQHTILGVNQPWRFRCGANSRSIMVKWTDVPGAEPVQRVESRNSHGFYVQHMKWGWGLVFFPRRYPPIPNRSPVIDRLVADAWIF